MMTPPRVHPAWAALAIAVVLIGAGATYALARDSDVVVEQAYFVAAEPDGAHLNLTASLFMTNRGEVESSRVSITVFVVPSHSGVATYTAKTVAGTVPASTTQQVEIPVVVRDFNESRTYRVDFLVFEDGLLTQRGVGSVGWAGGHWSSKDGEAMAAGVAAEAPHFDRVG